MKFNQIIIISGIISLLLSQNVSANTRSDSSSKNQSKHRSSFINKVQEDIKRLENRQKYRNDEKKSYSMVTEIYEPGYIKIDTSKKDLRATIIKREDEKKNNSSKPNIKKQELSKIEMEAKAAELNIEYKLKKLQIENDSLLKN